MPHEQQKSPGSPTVATDTGWPERRDVLHLAQRTNRCTVLGPGVRAVLWVQGCPFRCPGCVAPETLPFQGGTAEPVVALAEELAGLPDIEGVTFSGGEPMSQAGALAALVDAVRARRDLSFFCFTGFSLDHLRGEGTEAQRALLQRLDVLVDGPYLRERHTDLRWRGSDNQGVHFLTDRYRHLAPAVRERGSWIEFEMLPDGGVRWMGIPPAGFRGAFERAMAREGVELRVPRTARPAGTAKEGSS